MGRRAARALAALGATAALGLVACSDAKDVDCAAANPRVRAAMERLHRIERAGDEARARRYTRDELVPLMRFIAATCQQ